MVVIFLPLFVSLAISFTPQSIDAINISSARSSCKLLDWEEILSSVRWFVYSFIHSSSTLFMINQLGFFFLIHFNSIQFNTTLCILSSPIQLNSISIPFECLPSPVPSSPSSRRHTSRMRVPLKLIRNLTHCVSRSVWMYALSAHSIWLHFNFVSL